MKQDYRTKHKWTIDDPDPIKQDRLSRSKRKTKIIRLVVLIAILILLAVGVYLGKRHHHQKAEHITKQAPKTTEIQLILPHTKQ